MQYGRGCHFTKRHGPTQSREAMRVPHDFLAWGKQTRVMYFCLFYKGLLPFECLCDWKYATEAEDGGIKNLSFSACTLGMGCWRIFMLRQTYYADQLSLWKALSWHLKFNGACRTCVVNLVLWVFGWWYPNQRFVDCGICTCSPAQNVSIAPHCQLVHFTCVQDWHCGIWDRNYSWIIVVNMAARFGPFWIGVVAVSYAEGMGYHVIITLVGCKGCWVNHPYREVFG